MDIVNFHVPKTKKEISIVRLQEINNSQSRDREILNLCIQGKCNERNVNSLKCFKLIQSKVRNKNFNTEASFLFFFFFF